MLVCVLRLQINCKMIYYDKLIAKWYTMSRRHNLPLAFLRSHLFSLLLYRFFFCTPFLSTFSSFFWGGRGRRASWWRSFIAFLFFQSSSFSISLFPMTFSSFFWRTRGTWWRRRANWQRTILLLSCTYINKQLMGHIDTVRRSK